MTDGMKFPMMMITTTLFSIDNPRRHTDDRDETETCCEYHLKEL